MQSVPILVKNGFIVTVNSDSEVFRGDILVGDKKILKIGKNIDHQGATIFDASDYIVSPGFIS